MSLPCVNNTVFEEDPMQVDGPSYLEQPHAENKDFSSMDIDATEDTENVPPKDTDPIKTLPRLQYADYVNGKPPVSTQGFLPKRRVRPQRNTFIPNPTLRPDFLASKHRPSANDHRSKSIYHNRTEAGGLPFTKLTEGASRLLKPADPNNYYKGPLERLRDTIKPDEPVVPSKLFANAGKKRGFDEFHADTGSMKRLHNTDDSKIPPLFSAPKFPNRSRNTTPARVHPSEPDTSPFIIDPDDASTPNRVRHQNPLYANPLLTPKLPTMASLNAAAAVDDPVIARMAPYKPSPSAFSAGKGRKTSSVTPEERAAYTPGTLEARRNNWRYPECPWHLDVNEPDPYPEQERNTPRRRTPGIIHSVFNKANDALANLSHFWGWVRGNQAAQAPPYEPQQILAVELDGGGRKRRAVDASPSQSRRPSAELPGQYPGNDVGDTPRKEAADIAEASRLSLWEAYDGSSKAAKANAEAEAIKAKAARAQAALRAAMFPKDESKALWQAAEQASLGARGHPHTRSGKPLPTPALLKKHPPRHSSAITKRRVCGSLSRRGGDVEEGAAPSRPRSLEEIVRAMPSAQLARFREMAARMGGGRARLRAREAKREAAEKQRVTAEQAAEKERSAAEQVAARDRATAEHEQLLNEELARQAAEKQRAVAERAALEATLVRPLDPEWDARVSEAMKASPQTALAMSALGNELRLHDFKTLVPSEGSRDTTPWLNDDVVNSFLAAIVRRKQEQTGYVKSATSTPPFVAYNSGWYNNYRRGGMKGIKSWSRRQQVQGQRLLAAEKIFFPVNTGKHWMLLIISPTTHKIEFLDSIDGGYDRKFFDLAHEWLEMELGAQYDKAAWTEERGTKSSLQLNQDDCGVFACINALAAAKGHGFDAVPAARMSEARKLMAAVFLNGGLMGDYEL